MIPTRLFRFLKITAPASWILLSLSCAHQNSALRRHDDLVAAGQWLHARRSIDEISKQGPISAELAARLEQLNRRARYQVNNLEIHPLQYFYARAYIDYFENKRYHKAAEALRQVLIYELDNEEVVRFLELAKTHFESEEAEREKRLAQDLKRAQLLQAAIETAIASKAGQPAEAPPPPPPPDPEWLEARYEEALTAYFKRDMSKARKIIEENVRQDPGNLRWKKVIERIDRELAAAR